MAKTLKVVSPINDQVYVERPFADGKTIETALTNAVRAQKAWRSVPVVERAPYIKKFVDAFQSLSARISEELSWQMGRPLRYGPMRCAERWSAPTA